MQQCKGAEATSVSLKQQIFLLQMCGIAGFVYADHARLPEPLALGAMCDAIRHRGPDDEGRMIESGVAMGMRRLSIIDVAGGHQPLWNEAETIAVFLNGEIYNYRELKSGLVSRGHVFRTDSDTEVIAHLWEEQGPGCVESLRGMFAIALWDRATRTLFLARDRFGIKPLYLAEGPWGLAWASELKAFLAAGVPTGGLDWEALEAYFQLGYIPAPRSPFSGVRKLEPGHALTWQAGRGVREWQYWDVPTAEVESTPRIEEKVLEWLDDAVRSHLVADVPIAALLSGGIDSSAVVSSAVRLGWEPHAFTARYLGSGAESADETGLARLLANRYGVRLTVVDIAPSVTDLLDPIAWAMDEPMADESVVPTWLISQAVAREYKVVLSGAGGDELFAGYRRHFGHLLGNRWQRVPRPLRRAAAAVVGAMPDLHASADRWKRFVRAGDQTPALRYASYASRLPAEQRRALLSPVLGDAPGGSAGRHFDAKWRAAGSPGGLSTALYLDYKTYLPDDILALSDRLSSAHSLEVRVPFVDHHFVEAAFPLADSVKIGRGKPKHLLRRALEHRLPAEHFRAPKRGFVGPTAAWLRHELRDVVRAELAPSRLAALGAFDVAVAQRLLDEHERRRENREGILWALLMFLTWHRAFVERRPAPLRSVV